MFGSSLLNGPEKVKRYSPYPNDLSEVTSAHHHLPTVTVAHPTRIYAGVAICQFQFTTPIGKVEKTYKGMYTKPVDANNTVSLSAVVCYPTSGGSAKYASPSINSCRRVCHSAARICQDQPRPV